MPHIPASQALARFRVIDMTQVRAGPTAARQLADWGADVIQVQMPEHMRGDDTLGGQDGSDYQYTHRNERSITLNLKEPEGIATLKKLINGADVVVENFRIRPERSVVAAAGVRPDRARDGWPDVRDGAARRRTGARRHSDCGSLR